jgi:uncharacterized membrane protein
MRRSLGLFVLLVVIAIVCAGIGVYYLIPNVPGGHILFFSISGNPNTYHLKHALVFFALAVLALLGVRYVQPLPTEKIKTRRLVESASKPGKDQVDSDKTS